MKRNILTTVNKWLTIITFILAVVFTLTVIGHTIFLAYERIDRPKKSAERWHLLEIKLRHNIILEGENTDSVYYWHEHKRSEIHDD